jgi:putative serine protease PepD
MSNSTKDHSSSASAVPPVPDGSRAPAAPRPSPTATGAASPPAVQSRTSRAPQSRETHPVLVVVGALALLAVIFGAGFFGGRVGAGANDLEQTTIGVINAVYPSMVQVQARGSGPAGGIGSGEILTSSGYIVTNSHVIHGMTSYAVLLANGDTVPAKLIADVPEQDLAVLKVNATNLKPIPVGNSSQVQVGEFVVAMGSPLGLEQSATQGIVSALNREGREKVDNKTYTLTGMIQTSAAINPGNSGGALVNTEGQLIGIPTLSAVDPTTGVAANGIGFAISSNQMEAIVSQYIPAGS